jgi:hypothetical protein
MSAGNDDRDYLAESFAESEREQARTFTGVGETYEQAVRNAFTVAEAALGNNSFASVQVIEHHGRSGGSWSDHKVLVAIRGGA